MKETYEQEPIDMTEPFYGFEEPPESFIQECKAYWDQYWKTREDRWSDADKAFYGMDEEGQEFFYIGKTRIKVTEHFPATGSVISKLMEDMIRYDAARNDNFRRE